jgi:hypothetical protein
MKTATELKSMKKESIIATINLDRRWSRLTDSTSPSMRTAIDLKMESATTREVTRSDNTIRASLSINHTALG